MLVKLTPGAKFIIFLQASSFGAKSLMLILLTYGVERKAQKLGIIFNCVYK
jgi:hypothetical protein